MAVKLEISRQSRILLNLILAGLFPLAIPLLGYSALESETTRVPSFEVVSLRPNNSGAESMQWNFNQSDFTARNITVRKLISIAYNINSDNEVVGLPRWADSARLDVEAKLSDEAAAPFQKLNPQQQWKEI